MDTPKLHDITITDSDISWVESVMGSGINFDEARKAIIKNLESVDIQAFPGSGKTTTLVAKLAILAKKWPFSNAGICVLSHTNVAREEIESRLGNTTEGKKLLSYPHFIGTFHSFFDTFISIPWLRSQDNPVHVIDTDYVCALRWKMLQPKTQSYFRRYHKNEKLCSYYNSWENIDWENSGRTRQELLDAITHSQKKGFFTFDEMLLLAQKILADYPFIAESIQERFPLLFIDEAQDTNSLLWDLIFKVFPKDSIRTIRQGFGDINQAIYSYINEDVHDPEFPRSPFLLLNESKRFDNRIATLANSVAISKDQMIGTNNNFSEKNIPHTIFLFSKEKAPLVIDEFAKLILNTFSDQELQDNANLGCHIIGMVHKKNDDTPEKHFPKGIYDYWSNYAPLKTTTSSLKSHFINYFRIGKYELINSGNMADLIDSLSKGLCIIINRAAGTNLVHPTNNTFLTIEKILPSEKRSLYRQSMLDLASTEFQTKDDWDLIINKVLNILELFDLSVSSRDMSFLKWTNDTSVDGINDSTPTTSNCYLYQDSTSNRSINLEFGSIHSVKGRTHLATLVLETFSRAHNIKSILDYLCGKPPQKTAKANISRLKCQYVAMSRATALLCMAIPIDFVDDITQKLLTDNGWQLQILT